MNNTKFSFFGIGIGAIAFLMAIIHFWYGPFSPPPVEESSFAKKSAAIKQATIALFKGEKPAKPEPTRFDIDKAFDLVTAIIGGLAILLGVFGFAKNEPLRAAGSAAVIGASAMAFQYLVIALSMIFVAFVVIIFIAQFIS